MPSSGQSHRPPGNEVDRVYHFLSDLEQDIFNILEYADEVIDIREQFPLDNLELSSKIADELGINHPSDSSTDKMYKLSTDFMITVRKGEETIYLARTVKYEKELNKRRVLEKFDIEMEYWKRHEVDFGIYTEKSYNKTMARNLDGLRRYYHLERIIGSYDLSNDLLLKLENMYQFASANNKSVDLIFLGENCGIDLKLIDPMSRHLIVRKALKIDLNYEYDIRNIKVIDFNKIKFKELMEKYCEQHC